MGLIFGAFYGLLISQRFFPGLISGSVYDDSWLKKILRVCVGVSTTLIWYNISSLVGKAGFTEPYVLLFSKKLIPNLIIGLFFFFVTDLLNTQLGLVTFSKKEELKKGENDEAVANDEITADDE